MSAGQFKRLMPEQLRTVERMASKGCTSVQIAEVVGCDANTVRDICKRHGWTLQRILTAARRPHGPKKNHAVSHPQNTSGQVTLVRSCAYAEKPETFPWRAA